MSPTTLRRLATVFAGIALVSGGLQLWAYAATDGVRHLILGMVAVAVGAVVLLAIARGAGGRGDPRSRSTDGESNPGGGK